MSHETQPYAFNQAATEVAPEASIQLASCACSATGASSGAASLTFGSWSPQDLQQLDTCGTPDSAATAHWASVAAGPTGSGPGLAAPSVCLTDVAATAAAAATEQPTVPCQTGEGLPMSDGCAYPAAQLGAPHSAPICQRTNPLTQQQQTQQLLPRAQQQSLILLPAGSPLVAAPVTNAVPALGYALGATSIGWTSPLGWGAPCAAAGCVQQPYYPYMPYTHGTGFWLQGFYFASYEHLLAYRRCAIAYNYHFFGIRPHFRPPPNLPRPRRSTAGRRAARPSAPASDEAAAVGRAGPATPVKGDGDGNACGAGKVAEDGESLCGSPGGSSTCSTGDSDDTGSDTSRGEAAAAAELLGESQMVTEGPLLEVPSAFDSPPAVRQARCGAPGGAAALEEALLSEPSSPAAVQGTRMLPPSGFTSVAQNPEACVAGVPHALSGCRHAAGVGNAAGGGSPDGARAQGRVPGAAPLPLPVAPLRCQGVRHCGGVGNGGYTQDQAVCEAFLAVCSATSPTACMCPTWFEPDIGDMVGLVVGEALWGAEDSA